MRTMCLIAILGLVGCSSAPSKDGTPNSNANNTANNISVNNGTTANNVVANNTTNANLCGGAGADADPAAPFAPEQLRGLQGTVDVGETGAVVVAVLFDRLDLMVGEVQMSYFFEGADLTTLFEVGDEVVILYDEVQGDLDSAGYRIESIAGPTGEGVELGWAFSDTVGELVEPTISLPLSAGTVSLGEVRNSNTCLVDAGCALQPRTTMAFDLVVDYRGELQPLTPSSNLEDDEYSFHFINAGATSWDEVVTEDECVAEGGATASFTVSAWGRVFL